MGHELAEKSLWVEFVDQASIGNIGRREFVASQLLLGRHLVTDGQQQLLTGVVQVPIRVCQVAQILTVEMVHPAQCQVCYVVKKVSVVVP